LSQFNLVICFHPGKLGTKPDFLTRRWDVYPKEGGSDYAAVNLHNFWPVFTNEQLTISLRATSLFTPVLRVAITIDIESLHSDIRSGLHSNPAVSGHLNNPTLRWSLNSEGPLLLDIGFMSPTSTISDYEYYSTSMTILSPDTLDKIVLLISYIVNMYGQISETPLSPTSNLVPLVCAQSHRDINPMDF
jgi:hypothetical protein